MPFNYTSISFTNINKDGTALSPALTFAPAATPASVNRFAIGNRVRIAVQITASGGSNWNNKDLRCNLCLYRKDIPSDAPDFGFETSTPVTGVATAGQFVGGSDGLQLTRQNIEAVTFQLTAPNVVTMTIDFYVTCDVDNYISTAFFINNQVRFLQSRFDNFSFPLQNTGNSVFTLLEAMGISTIIKPVAGTQEYVFNPATGRNFWRIPMSARWYNSDFPVLSGTTWTVPTTQRRWMSQVVVTSPSQIAAGLPTLTQLGAPTWLSPSTANVDSMFTVNPFPPGNQLAYNEPNTVTITLDGYSSGAFAVTAITYIRAILIRSDRFQNNLLFPDNYSMSEAIIPSAFLPATQLDGAIYGPTSWSQNMGTGQISITFRLDGTLLEVGREYRIIINVYENALPERPTAHITPPLYVQYVPPAVPTITGYMGHYAQDYATNELQDIAPHQRIRARIEIDKASYAAALAALGFTSTFDACFSEVSATLLAATGIGATTETYKPNTLLAPLNNGILTAGMTILVDDGLAIVPAATFRIEEERAGTTATILWNLKMNQPNFVPGSFTVFDIQFDQLVHIKDFENDAMVPQLVNIRFLDKDAYPTTKIDVIDLCDRDKVIVEVEKDPALTGSVNFIATIYPASETGDTTNPQIQEEEDWIPAVPVLPQLTSGLLDAVETSFGGDDFVTFEINAQQLVLGQRYWVTGIAIQQVPDYCPIGLVALCSTSTQRSLTAIPGWFIVGDCSLLIAEILAHPDYVPGTVNVVQNNVVDIGGAVVGLINTTVGYQHASTKIDTALLTVYYTVIVEAQFDPGTGAHTVRHTLQIPVPLPPANIPPIVVFSNSYVCSDLG